MSAYAVSSGGRIPKIIELAEDEDIQQRLKEYYLQDNRVALYIVVEQAENYLLRKLRIKPGSIVTELRPVDVEFEDIV